MQPIQGIHHITAVAAIPSGTSTSTCGCSASASSEDRQHDDPGTYHLYYGDLVGSPGTIMTFFPWRFARQGAAGQRRSERHCLQHCASVVRLLVEAALVPQRGRVDPGRALRRRCHRLPGSRRHAHRTDHP
ncbi:MAG: hypothetical protein R2838_07735 [Caldilineaceae bacterium]